MKEKKAQIVNNDNEIINNDVKVERRKFTPIEKKEDLLKINDRPNVDEMDKESVNAEIKELEEIASSVTKELNETEYPIKIENETYLKDLMKFVEKDIPWQHRNAILVVSLYDELRSAKATGIDNEGNIWILGKDIAHLYNSLAQRTGEGFFSAKAHIRLVTAIGDTVSEAMKMVADDNQILRDLHTRLSALDKRLEDIAIAESGVQEENVEDVKTKSAKLQQAQKMADEILKNTKKTNKEE